MTDSDLLMIGRLEDKLKLYEPILSSLSGITSVTQELKKLQENLQTLTESSIETRNNLKHMIFDNDKCFSDLDKLLNIKITLLDDLENRMIVVELDKETLAARYVAISKQMDSFKIQGWKLFVQFVPWAIALGCTLWAMNGN